MKPSSHPPARFAVRLIAAATAAVSLGAAEPLGKFVWIKGGTFHRGAPSAGRERAALRVEDFEMLDHPVTNAEYRRFVAATNHPAPLHWSGGRIPAGKEDHPVIFVNRADVRAFLAWLSAADGGRAYRLPTTAEFEYAASGGAADRPFPWGAEPPAGRANFDPTGDRPYDRWQDFLQPAASGAPNAFGLFGLAGNVWQMAITRADPAIATFRYRIEDPPLLETAVMGGSWARTADYLQRGAVEGVGSGIRFPDAGFRPVRAPAGRDWRERPRRLTGIPQGSKGILLSWSMLADDPPGLGFHVYRAASREHDGFPLTTTPITDRSTFLDTTAGDGRRFQYYVRPVDASGRPGSRSEWIGVTATGAAPQNIVVTFEPLFRQGSLVPVFGDLNGDGAMDCVIRLDNGNSETSQDPGLPVQLEAFTSWGRSLWRKDVAHHDHCWGNSNNVPFNVWDMDGDGRAEVITFLQVGSESRVAVLDGLTGAVKHSAPWTPLASDFQKSSTRVMLSVACLDGRHPAVITQSGLYENEILTAYDHRLNRLWQFQSFAETSGSGGHKIEAADVDGDGRQEIFNGTTCLNPDGTVRWSIFRQHPDLVSIQDYLPDRPGLEVCYVIETKMHAGIYLVDANTGQVIWKRNREDDRAWTHGHHAWTADIWAGSPGLECMTNRAGHQDFHLQLFSADGRLLHEPFPRAWSPIEWDGDSTRELLSSDGRAIGDFDGRQIVVKPGVVPNLVEKSSLIMVADLYGDFRDEIVLLTPTAKGGRAVTVVMAAEEIPLRFVGALEEREYRYWIARNKGGGYASIHDRQLVPR
jgi:formylglycine-generating enzyme required for sulfatase activity